MLFHGITRKPSILPMTNEMITDCKKCRDQVTAAMSPDMWWSQQPFESHLWSSQKSSYRWHYFVSAGICHDYVSDIFGRTDHSEKKNHDIEQALVRKTVTKHALVTPIVLSITPLIITIEVREADILFQSDLFYDIDSDILQHWLYVWHTHTLTHTKRNSVAVKVKMVARWAGRNRTKQKSSVLSQLLHSNCNWRGEQLKA